jgi:hypothetical protein
MYIYINIYEDIHASYFRKNSFVHTRTHTRAYPNASHSHKYCTYTYTYLHASYSLWNPSVCVHMYTYTHVSYSHKKSPLWVLLSAQNDQIQTQPAWEHSTDTWVDMQIEHMYICTYTYIQTSTLVCSSVCSGQRLRTWHVYVKLCRLVVYPSRKALRSLLTCTRRMIFSLYIQNAYNSNAGYSLEQACMNKCICTH